MIKWSRELGKWVFIFTVDIPLSIICDNYKEAWFFRTYEEDMDFAFVQDYIYNTPPYAMQQFEAFLAGVID